MIQTILAITGIVTTNPEPLAIDGRSGLNVITWILVITVAFFIKRWINSVEEKIVGVKENIEEIEKRHQKCREELPDKYAKIETTKDLKRVSEKVVEHTEKIKHIEKRQEKTTS